MATFVKTVLPSGRGLWLEKLTTRRYRAVVERVASRLPDESKGAIVATRLGFELLLASFRGVTPEILPVVMTADGSDIDVDAMLTNATAWITPTFEELIITDGTRSLEVLLDDPADYLTAEGLATNELGGGQASGLRGKVKREFVER